MDCPSFQELNLSDWSETLIAPLQGERYPLSGIFELTDRCNLGCVHCYINQPAASQEIKSRELNTAQVTHILDQMAEAGCLFLVLTGGEVLLRPDFLEIYRHARMQGMLVTIFTNGTLITPKIADYLGNLRPQSIEITLYGATQKTYESVTQVPGSYERCLRGIDLLLEQNLPLSLKSVLISKNLQELDEMEELANRLGVKYRYDGMLWPRLDGSQQPYEYQLSLRELSDLEKNNEERQLQWIKMYHKYEGQKIREKYVYNCGAGLRSFHIDSSGKLCLCTMSRNPSYDLQSIPFEKAWKLLGSQRDLLRQKETKCTSCTIGSICIQCPGWSQAFHDDLETPVDFICQTAHMRNLLISKLS